MSAAEVAAEICRLESDLVTAWLRRPEVRGSWPMVPSEFYSPHVRLLAEAGAALTDPDGDITSAIMCDGNRRKAILAQFGESPLFSLEYVSDIPATLGRVRSLRSMLLVQEGVLAAVSRVSPDANLGKILSDLREAMEAAEQITRKQAYSEQDLFGEVIKSVGENHARALTTGFHDLDSLTGGIRPGHVWAFGAPTNWGKSSWLLALVDRWLTVHNKPVLYVTCEDDPGILGSRLLSKRLNINGKNIRDNRLTPENHADMVSAWEGASKLEIMLDGRGMVVEDLATAIRARVKADGIGLVLVDYLQCIDSQRQAQDRRNQINYIARTLTSAIKTTGAAGVLASQVTDENLRESRDLENAAEVVIIGRQAEAMGNEPGERSLYLKKNKTGSKDRVIIVPWCDETGSFDNITEGEKMMEDEGYWDN